VTPILVRPVREQLEHDRLIRFLLTKLKAKRKFDVLANVGDTQQAPVKVGDNTYFPDLVLMEGKKLSAVIEVETGESTNNLEAMAQWTHFSRARVPFHLYVPVLFVDAARRLCEAHQVMASEIWSYRAVNDQFDLVRVHANPDAVKAAMKIAAAQARASAKASAPAPEPAAKSAGKGAAAASAKSQSRSKPKPAKSAKPKAKAKAKPPAKKAKKKK
jgi:hypothetical protein